MGDKDAEESTEGWQYADVVTDETAQPLPLEGGDQPQLVLYVFLACLAMHYLMWAVRAKNPAEVGSSMSRSLLRRRSCCAVPPPSAPTDSRRC
jgi:hypothetical protein